ncbi:MAG: hypothetical protein QXR63_07065 [Candidatus Bathyarchaeia archaeon]
MEKGSYAWFERRRKNKALELAQQQITKALDTATLLHQAVQSSAQGTKTWTNAYTTYSKQRKKLTN